jgi:hypothetical protein
VAASHILAIAQTRSLSNPLLPPLEEALRASGVEMLAASPDFELHLAVGDSLLHGQRAGMKDTASLLDEPQAYAGTGFTNRSADALGGLTLVWRP